VKSHLGMARVLCLHGNPFYRYNCGSWGMLLWRNTASATTNGLRKSAEHHTAVALTSPHHKPGQQNRAKSTGRLDIGLGSRDNSKQTGLKYKDSCLWFSRQATYLEVPAAFHLLRAPYLGKLGRRGCAGQRLQGTKTVASRDREKNVPTG
jgi:hypothetical protein